MGDRKLTGLLGSKNWAIQSPTGDQLLVASLWDQYFLHLHQGVTRWNRRHPQDVCQWYKAGRGTVINTLDSRTPVKGTLTGQNGLADFSGSSKKASTKSCTWNRVTRATLQARCQLARKQLCRKGSEGSGGQQIEQESTVCSQGKEGVLHAGPY